MRRTAFTPREGPSLKRIRIASSLALGVALCCTFLVAPARAHEGLEERIASVTRRIRERPEDAALRLERAEYFRLGRDWASSLADLKQAQGLAPALAAIPLARARLLVDAKAGERALVELDAFARLEGAAAGAATATLLRAQALQQLGRGAEASAAFDQAIAGAARPDPDVYFARAQCQFALGALDDAWRARAIAGLDEGVARLGGALQLEELALSFEEASAAWDAALSRIERLARGSPRPMIWRARAARLLEQAGRAEEALALAGTTLAELKREPAHVRARPATRALVTELEELQRRRGSLTATGATDPCGRAVSGESRLSPSSSE